MADNLNINDYQLPDDMLEMVAGGVFSDIKKEQMTDIIMKCKNLNFDIKDVEVLMRICADHQKEDGVMFTSDEAIELLHSLYGEA